LTDQAPPPPQQPIVYGSGQPVYYAPRPTNTLAIVAFVLAFFVSIAAIICGYIALGQIRRTGEGGHGLALAAVILGWVSIALSIIIVIVYFLFFAALVTSANYN
jgi:uncharacterized membrane protein